MTTYHGAGRIAGARQGRGAARSTAARRQTLETKAIVIATGSDIIRLPGIEIDEKRIVSSTGALDLDKVPGHLLVIGAGVIGLELGSVWRRLGAKVTVVEFLDRIVPGMDSEVAKQFQRILQKQGMEFRLGQKVSAVKANGAGPLKVQVQPAQGDGPQEIIEADVVLVAVGRIPYTEGLGLEDAGVQIDNKRRIVDRRSFQDQRERHLRHRRRGARPDARPQGRGRGRRRRRDHRRQSRARELRRHPGRDLHLSRGRERRRTRKRS